jgi:hypothetical protein
MIFRKLIGQRRHHVGGPPAAYVSETIAAMRR